MSDRKKAIETLKENLCAMCAYGSQNMESCDIRSCDNRDAIKALEQEPTTKNDLGVDCISRADAIKGLGEQPYVWTDSDYEIQQLTDWKNHKEMLENLPSVTPQEPKTGHWIFVGQENEEETRNGNFRYICSECGYSDVHAKSTEVPYCWHCGAKMVDPQESEDKE